MQRTGTGKEAILLLAAGFLGLSGPVWAGGVDEPADYRMDEYRAPVPDTLRGATVVTTQQAQALWQGKKAVFVDVMPHAPKPANLPAGTIWRDKVRDDIPGSIWLVNVGYGALSQEASSYFQQGLEATTGADKSRPIVFYCMTDCWMSWNAARRAVALGYRSVHWYPVGADGWASSGLPLAENTPYVQRN